MGSWPPPGCWVPKQGPSPRPGRRMAQEAFEAYGKSSPLPALPHHLFPPGYVPPPVSRGTGGSRHGTLSTMQRRGDYRQGATAAGDPGPRGLYHGEGREGPREKPPPPAAAKCLIPCLRPACVVPATCVQRREEDMGAPPPPHTPAPPRVGDAGRGGRKAPPPEDKAAGWEGSGERVRDGPHDRAPREHVPCKPWRGDHRGCERRVERATTEATTHAPPPCRATGAVPRASAVLASCLRHARNEGKTTSPPPPTDLRPPKSGRWRKGRADSAPPPPRGQSGKVGRRRREGARRTTRQCRKEARAVQAPAEGAPWGRTQDRKGDDGSRTESPPPPAEGQVPRLVPAPCLRCAYATGRTARAPPPHHLLPRPPRKGARTARRWRGDMGGGAEDRPTCQGERQAASSEKKRKKKENKEQSKPTRQGKKARRQGPKPRRTEGGRGDMGPQVTLGKYPTTGVWGPQRGNPPPHCSLGLCLRRACVVPATCVLQREDDKGDKGDDSSGTRTPPRGQRGRVGRQRREGAGRTTRPCPKGARAVQAPTAGPPGVRPQGR